MTPKNSNPYFPPTNQVVINQKIEPVLARPCHPCQPVRPQPITGEKHKIPVSGPLTGNGFRLESGVPYLVDTTQMTFGAKINVGDNVYTRITKRSDIGCIDLSARIDMTTSTHGDTALVKYLNDTIMQSYKTLEQYLPVMKSEMLFTLYYNILDSNRGIVTSGTMQCYTENIKFHETNINDYYLISAYSTMIADIQPMEYGGPYFIELTKIDACIPSFNTKDHLDAGLNPYYAFNDDYTSITIDHEAVKDVIDEITMIPIVETVFTDGNIFEFQANLSTRFKFTFEAYLSDMIWETNTYETYEALYNPVLPRVEALEQQVADLTSALETANENITALDNRVTALEAIVPPMTVYEADKEIIAGQLTYKTIGILYQATETFIASGDIEEDVNAGKIVQI